MLATICACLRLVLGSFDLSFMRESFFSKSKLPLQTWLQLMHHWSMDMPVTQAAKQAKISEKRCIDVYQFMRDVCSTKLLSAPIILEGPGTVVQIDESLFVHNRKVGTNYFTFPYNYCYPSLDPSPCKMVVAVDRHKNSGYLGWWTHPQGLPLDTWNWSKTGLQLL